jgi:hypothetical protein
LHLLPVYLLPSLYPESLGKLTAQSIQNSAGSIQVGRDLNISATPKETNNEEIVLNIYESSPEIRDDIILHLYTSKNLGSFTLTNISVEIVCFDDDIFDVHFGEINSPKIERIDAKENALIQRVIFFFESFSRFRCCCFYYKVEASKL